MAVKKTIHLHDGRLQREVLTDLGKIRVLFVTGMYPTSLYPARGLSVKPQVEALQQAGIQVTVRFFDGRSSRLNYLKGMLNTVTHTSRQDFDIVHGHYVYGGLVARCQLGLPLVVSFTGSDVTQSKTRWLCKLVAKMADAVIVKSPRLKELLNLDKTHIIPNGVDMERFHPISQALARNTLGLSLTPQCILFVGSRDSPAKRFDRAQAAVKELRLLVPDVEIDFLSLLDKRVPHEQMPLYLNAADVLLLTSDWEGSPNIIKEAMACNLPIVATDVGDVQKVIGDTEGCYVVESVPTALAEGLKQAFNYGQRTNGREHIAWLSNEKTAQRIISVYRDVIGSHARRSSRC